MLSTVCPCCPFSTLRWPMERGAAAALQRERWAGERCERTSAKDDQRELAGCHVSRNKKKEESSLSSSSSGQHGRATQSCTGAFLRLPGKAATQQNAVLHGRLFALARHGSNTIGEGTGAFLRLPVTAATQQNAVLHGRLFTLARQSSNAAERSLARAPCFACQGRQQHTWQARRSSSTTGS